MQLEREHGILAAILSDEVYLPTEPGSLESTGLPISLIEGLVCKRLSIVGTSSGRKLADDICIPFRVLEDLYNSLRSRQILVHRGSAPLNDYNYMLTEKGREFAHAATDACAYVGPAPVPLMDYVLSTEAQTIRAESPKRAELRIAFKSITVDENIFECLGPAINSGAGLFLYGEPGNGKSTLAKCITMCFGQDIWIPHAIFEDGQIIKLYDAAFHEPATGDAEGIIKSAAFDQRWVKIKRPTVVVGGELTMDALEIRHDPQSNVSEASLQMKSNGGCLLVDDFGRQRIEPKELLNRWIVPLESRVDYLSLSTGKKIQVPFEQLIIFSTNLEPSDLVDEAFLRRIPYKIEIGDPSVDEFQTLFHIYSRKLGFEYRPDVVQYLIQTHYEATGRSLRRCHPRDLLSQIRDYCVYNELPLEMRRDYIDRVVHSYFTVVIADPNASKARSPVAYQEPLRAPLAGQSTMENKMEALLSAPRPSAPPARQAGSGHAVQAVATPGANTPTANRSGDSTASQHVAPIPVHSHVPGQPAAPDAPHPSAAKPQRQRPAATPPPMPPAQAAIHQARQVRQTTMTQPIPAENAPVPIPLSP